jgi:hypothetical protein
MDKGGGFDFSRVMWPSGNLVSCHCYCISPLLLVLLSDFPKFFIAYRSLSLDFVFFLLVVCPFKCILSPILVRHTNVGRASNLTEDGHVEWDASIMDGLTWTFGDIGRVIWIENPIQVATLLVKDRMIWPSLFGCIPPMYYLCVLLIFYHMLDHKWKA